MNKSKIEWTDFTFNPVTGCKHGCPYCYARKISKRFKRSFEPLWHSDRLSGPIKRKKPAKIFVCSMSDLFGYWVPDVWIQAVLEVVRRCPQHTFQFLTKNPERLAEFNPWPENCWVGATTVDRDAYKRAVKGLGAVVAPVRFISAEPLLGPLESQKTGAMEALGFMDWIIIGAMTGPGATAPKKEWVDIITKKAWDCYTPVFHKDNLGNLATLKEFPNGR